MNPSRILQEATRIIAASAVAVGFIMGADLIGLAESPDDAAVVLIIGAFGFGLIAGIQASPIAGLLVMLPPIMQSLPEDPWVGLLTLFFFGLFAAVAVAAALVGGLLSMLPRWIAQGRVPRL